jgi:2-C-methyl-D-erythritol 4-phosphate cytidylyltransferase
MNNFKEKIIIVVAGGSGSRMKTEIPKQFLKIGQIPIIIHTLFRFYEYEANAIFILVLPTSENTYWHKIINDSYLETHFGQNFIQFLVNKIQVVEGGNTRFQSVKNGLNAVKTTDGIVCIHDGVRPFISKEIIEQGFATSLTLGNAVTAVVPKDSQRWIDEEGNNKYLERNRVRIIQTPQIFELKLLRKAYQTDELSWFTDDASVVEHAGYGINLIEGSYENIKITTPEDLIFAEIILAKK